MAQLPTSGKFLCMHVQRPLHNNLYLGLVTAGFDIFRHLLIRRMILLRGARYGGAWYSGSDLRIISPPYRHHSHTLAFVAACPYNSDIPSDSIFVHSVAPSLRPRFAAFLGIIHRSSDRHRSRDYAAWS